MVDAMVLEIDDVSFSYCRPDEALPVLDGVSLHIGRGELVAVIGPSGCGKSTLFNLAAGLCRPDAGEIRQGEGIKAAYMPQRDLLLPWRTVLDNAVLGPDLQGGDLAAARQKAYALLPLFGLEGFAMAYPRELSGGMRQRAALLRTALLERELMLLDEPFGALDALTRLGMQEWLLTIQKSLDRTILLTTHDIDEAILLADRLYVLSTRPARVLREIAIPFPRPRSRSIAAQPEFISLKTAIWELLQRS